MIDRSEAARSPKALLECLPRRQIVHPGSVSGELFEECP
jgi:hypothetical protein